MTYSQRQNNLSLTIVPPGDAHDFAKVIAALRAAQNRRSERQKQKFLSFTIFSGCLSGILCHVQLIILSFLRKRRLMISALCDPSLIHDYNDICVADRGEAMGDYNTGTILHDQVHARFLRRPARLPPYNSRAPASSLQAFVRCACRQSHAHGRS